MERPLLLFRRDPVVPSLSHLIDMFRPGEPFIKGHPKITGVVDPFNWLPEELHCSGFRDAPTGLGEITAELFETLIAILQSLSHCSRSLR